MSYVLFLYIMTDHAGNVRKLYVWIIIDQDIAWNYTGLWYTHIVLHRWKLNISYIKMNIVCLASVKTGSVSDTNVSRFISHIIWRWHDDVIKWRHFPRHWPFVRGIHWSPVNSPHKGQWRGALVFSLICLNKRLSKQPWGWWFETPTPHYDVIVMDHAPRVWSAGK